MDNLKLMKVGEYKKLYPVNFWFQVVSFFVCLIATSIIASLLPDSTSSVESTTQSVENASIAFMVFQLLLIPGSILLPPLGLGLLLVNFSRLIIIIVSLPEIQDLIDAFEIAITQIEQAGDPLGISKVFKEEKADLEIAFGVSIILLLYTAVQIVYGGYFEYNRVTKKQAEKPQEAKVANV
eukprot:snap_masked-scaffold_54-processed-gene-1.43-mRNA-1 protein AED:0.12 eAED:0.13 QI:0/-1/0/1/-1/1/1/0/180